MENLEKNAILGWKVTKWDEFVRKSALFWSARNHRRNQGTRGTALGEQVGRFRVLLLGTSNQQTTAIKLALPPSIIARGNASHVYCRVIIVPSK
jgi:hypothetical protein